MAITCDFCLPHPGRTASGHRCPHCDGYCEGSPSHGKTPVPTKTPLVAHGSAIRNSDGGLIASVFSSTGLDQAHCDAARLVDCYNDHDALVKSVEELRSELFQKLLRIMTPEQIVKYPEIEHADAILAKVKAKR